MAKILMFLAINGIICLCYPSEVYGQNHPPAPGPPPSFGGPPPHPQEWDGQRWQGHSEVGNGYQNGYDNGFGNGNSRGTFGGGAFGGNQQPAFPNDGGIQAGRHSGVGGTPQGGSNFETRNTYNQQGGFRSTSGGYEGRSPQNNPQPIPPNGGGIQRGQQSGQGGTFEGGRDFQGGNGVGQQGGFRFASGGAERGSGSVSGQQGGVADSAGGRSRNPDSHQGGTDYQGRPGRRSRNQSGTQNGFEQRGRFFGSATGNQRSQNKNGVKSQNRFVGLTGRNTTVGSDRSGSFSLTK